MTKNRKGRPRGFRSAKHLLDWFYEYCETIERSGFATVPTKSGFLRWCTQVKGLKVSRRTLYTALREYYPEIRDELELVHADTIVVGTATGKYQQAIMIFALKNWCAWSDRTEPEASTQVNVVLPDEADEEAD